MVSASHPCGFIHAIQYDLHLPASEIGYESAREPLVWYREHPLDDAGVLWCFQRSVVIEGSERREPRIATAHAIGTARLQVNLENIDWENGYMVESISEC